MNLPLSKSDLPDELRDYPVVIRLPIQWGDQDAFGHVNNTVPIRWFESGRIAYFHHGGVEKWMQQHGVGPILASIKCDYRSQLHYPGTVLIATRVDRLGGASMTMSHLVYGEHERVVAAEGVGVVVNFDYDQNRPVRISDDFRAAIGELEQRAV